MENTALYWAQHACDTLMNKFEAALLPPEHRWHYHQGVFLKGMLLIWEQTGDNRYFEYVKAYADSLIAADGSFEFRTTELDSIMAGLILFDLYENTKDERYKIAADTLIDFLRNWKKNEVGGYWHKDRYPNQMWLDGLYMAGPFAVQYASTFKVPDLYDLIAEQAELMIKYTRDEKTGLLYHAWDCSKEVEWADKVTGKSPEFWSRSIGWVVIALNEILDFLPLTHPKRQALINDQKLLIDAIIKVQDNKSGMWFQVTDRTDDPQNWLEDSASCLFVAGIAKAARMGYIASDKVAVAQKGWKGIMDMVSMDGDGKVTIPEICIGTGVGDYQHYINRPRSSNDLHGVGAFLMACNEMARLA